MTEKKTGSNGDVQPLFSSLTFDFDYYKNLRKSQLKNRELDKAWCISSMLVFTDMADDEEKAYFLNYHPRERFRASLPLSEKLWIRILFHPDESLYIGKIFETVTQMIRRLKIEPLKTFGVRRSEHYTEVPTNVVSETFHYSARILNIVPPPELYIQENRAGKLNYAITQPPATVCGRTLLYGVSRRECLCRIALHLAYYRNEHYLRWLLPQKHELEAMLVAALKYANSTLDLPNDKKGVLDQYVSVIRQLLAPEEKDNLRKVTELFIEHGIDLNIEKWLRAVNLTAIRTGLLLSEDLKTMYAVITDEQDWLQLPKDWVQDFLLFSVSDEYFELRKAIGCNALT